MKQDIYWSHVCINALKNFNYDIFHYGIYFIEDSTRKKKLLHIYEKTKNNDKRVINVLNNYTCPIITYIT